MQWFVLIILIGVLAFASTNVSIEEALEAKSKKDQEVIENAYEGKKGISEWYDAI